MARPEISTKRLAISKANAQIVGIVGAASFVTVFCLFAATSVWGQNQYLTRLTKAKTTANNQLQHNITAYAQLANYYQKFNTASTNAIGGNPTGSGDNDGNNSKIILDALPSSYDFPALASSLEKILTERNFTISSITGSDDQVAQQTNLSSPKPEPVPIPFSFTVTSANYDSIQKLVATLQSSIRPIQIDSISLSGAVNNMQMVVEAHTYYQPGKNLTISKQVVK